MGDNDKDCVICISSTVDKTIAVLNNCKHFFCEFCAMSWITTNPTCPLDRSEISSVKIINKSGKEISENNLNEFIT